jgi:hypothetical protein
MFHPSQFLWLVVEMQKKLKGGLLGGADQWIQEKHWKAEVLWQVEYRADESVNGIYKPET